MVESDHSHHDHFASSVAVTAQGVELVTWLDRRNDLQNTQYETYGAASKDGGRTFPNVALATAPSPPLGGLWPGFVGGPLIVTTPGHAYAVWQDARTGTLATELGIIPQH